VQYIDSDYLLNAPLTGHSMQTQRMGCTIVARVCVCVWLPMWCWKLLLNGCTGLVDVQQFAHVLVKACHNSIYEKPR